MTFSANYYDSVNGLRTAVNTNKELLRKVEQLKEKSETFDSQSASYFSDISESATLVSEGLTSDGKIGASSWNGKGFSSTDHEWLNKVNGKWEERRYAKEHEDLIRLEDKWMNLTYEIRHVPGQNGMLSKEIWVNGKFDSNLTQEYQVLQGLRQRRDIIESPPTLTLKEALNLILELTVVGDMKTLDSSEASLADKALAMASIFMTFTPAKGAFLVSDGLKLMDKVGDTGRTLDKINDVNKSLDWANDVKKASGAKGKLDMY